MSLEARHAEENPACRVCAEGPEAAEFFTASEYALLKHLRDGHSRAFVHGYLLHLLGADGVARVVAAVHARERADHLAELGRRRAAENLGQPDSTDD